MTEELVRQLQTLLADPGLTATPWRDDNGYRVYGPDESDGCLFEGKYLAGTGADMAFCAAARNGLPLLLAENARLRALVAREITDRERAIAVLSQGESMILPEDPKGQQIQALFQRIRELKEALAGPVWENQPPKVPGLYWWRKRKGKVPTVLLVEEHEGHLIRADLDERIEDQGGQWCPAHEPGEPS